jgi:hypothetical protein
MRSGKGNKQLYPSKNSRVRFLCISKPSCKRKGARRARTGKMNSLKENYPFCEKNRKIFLCLVLRKFKILVFLWNMEIFLFMVSSCIGKEAHQASWDPRSKTNISRKIFQENVFENFYFSF